MRDKLKEIFKYIEVFNQVIHRREDKEDMDIAADLMKNVRIN